jgi:hypothetical protein
MSYQLLQNYIGKTPTKRIGEKTARKVEAAFTLPHGWMDQLQEGRDSDRTLDLIEERETILDRAQEIAEDQLHPSEPLDIWDEKKSAWVLDELKPPSIRQSSVRPQQFHEFERLTIELLPEELRKYADQRIQSGGFQARVDYLSDKVAVELKSAAYSHAVDSGLLQLATIRSMLPPEPPRLYALVLIEERGVRPRLQQAMIRGGLLGVEVYVARDPHEACSIIVGLERDPSKGLEREGSR